MSSSGLAAPVSILLAEDSESDIDLLKEVMEESKILNDLHVVTDGVAAMEFLRRRGRYRDAPDVDVVLLDLNMPKKSGIEVLKEVKDDKSLRSIPVVVLTSSKAEEDILKSYQLHANCYVTKPLDVDQFAKIVKAIETFWFSVVKLPPHGR
ncbi:MAG: response regulator [Proteobacteria bacterium]|nr:response regulator [Pseudomonadota bacterium]